MKMMALMIGMGALPVWQAVTGLAADTRRSMILVAFGDSTTAPRGPVQIYADCLKRELPKKGIDVEVHNAGVPGNNTEDGRRRFEKDVLDRPPDLVVIQFGINDSTVNVWQTPPATEPPVAKSRYVDNLGHFVDALRARRSEVILMTPNPMRWTPALKGYYAKPPYRPDDPDGLNVTLEPYVEAVRTLAQEKKVPLIDVYAVFQAYGKNPGQLVDDLLLDGMHPNDKGHRLVTDLLLAQILKLKGTGSS